MRNLLTRPETAQFDFFFQHVIYLCNAIAQLFQMYVELHSLKEISQV